jgi:hypothetical protein
VAMLGRELDAERLSAASDRNEKKKDDEAKRQTEAKKTVQDKKQDDFKRAISACLDTRGYSVR